MDACEERTKEKGLAMGIVMMSVAFGSSGAGHGCSFRGSLKVDLGESLEKDWRGNERNIEHDCGGSMTGRGCRWMLIGEERDWR